jgi:endonuclease IV
VLNSTTRANLLARKAKLETQISNLNDTFDSLSQQQIREYNFNSGEGSQQAKRRSLKDIQDALDRAQAELDAICRRLAGKGLTSIRSRR